MKNWSRAVQWQPAEVVYPSSETEVQQIVQRAAEQRRKIRLIGTGHSFTPLCQTDEILISLDNYQGLITVDRNTHQATVKAGTKLNNLGELLFKQGLAMENMGDIDAQSIAGTISTGTHGTGKAFGTISTQVIGLRLINGKGELVTCSPTENPELFKAAQVSLGALGVITAVTLQCMPAYKLYLQNRQEPLAAVLDTLDERTSQNRHFEYYWIPYTETAWTKTSNIPEDGEPDKINFFNYWTEYVLENYVFQLLCEYAHYFPSQNGRIANIMAASISNVAKIYYSHKVYATKRAVRFQEMEYNIPAEAYQEVMREVMRVVNSKKYNIHFPIESRWVKGDNIPLSPAYGRDSAYIACHTYYKKDHRPYFSALEEVFRAYGGRPHWGKMNQLTAADVVELYPEFEAFMQQRQAQDPDNLFVNSYLQQLLGIA